MLDDKAKSKQLELSEAKRLLEGSTQELADLEEQRAEIKEQIKFIRSSMLEINKLSFEAMKHLTTLSAGSILLLVTFLEKLFSNHREWTALIGVAIVLFILSIISAMSALIQSTMVATHFVTNTHDEHRRSMKKVATEFLAFVTFTLGIVILGIFALKNFY